MDKGKGKEKECFSSDRLFSRKRTVENANVDVDLKSNDPKKSKLLSGEKNESGFQFSVIRMSLLPVETEEEFRQRKEMAFLNRLEAKQRLEKMKKARAVKENGNSSLRLSGGSQASVNSTETQKLAIQGASGSGSESTVRAVASDVSLEEGMFRNLMLNMPLVSTRCVGPNGKKTQGRLLYKYNKGEEVTIVCVCHGNFLSPAEFVKHAGGGDVEDPLRHITIRPVANW